MSDRVRPILACAAALVLAGAAVAHAQSAPEYARRVDRLLAVVQEEAAASERSALSATRMLPHDTLRAGGLTIITDPSHAALATASARDAWLDLERVFGARAAELAGRRFVLRNRADSARQSGKLQVVLVGTIDSTGLVRDERSAYAERRDLANQWRTRASGVLTADLSPELRQWLGGNVILDSLTRATWVSAREELVTARARVTRDCVGGSVERCGEALGLTSVPDPIMSFYDPAERAVIVAQMKYTMRSRGAAVAFDRCTRGGERATCDSLAHLIPPDRVPMPIGGRSRELLLRLAFQVGGPGAFDRAARASGPVAGQLSAAAGIPADSLVALWRSGIVDTPAESRTLNGLTIVSSLFWATLCGALALRSSRWR